MKQLLLIGLTPLMTLHFLSSCGPGPVEKHLPLPDPVGDQAGQPGQNALLYYGEDEWPISCYFFDPKSKDFGQNLPIWNQAWVWAKTPKGQHVHAKGERQGGFIVVEDIYYSKTGTSAGLLPEIKTNDDLEKLCQDSIDRYYPKKGYKLVSIVASRNTQAITNLIDNAFPLVIGEKLNRNLVDRMVIFGDSLSDTGRLKRWIQIMPERPFFLGRFTNGGTWSDFLADKANLSALNYSTGGAVTKVDIHSPIQQVISYLKDSGRYFVTGSIRNFIRDYRTNELLNHKVPNAEKTLFVLWGGANDFLSKFDRKDDVNALIDKPEIPSLGAKAISRQTVLNIEQEIRSLIQDIGARHIVVANLPDIGITPSMANRDLFHKGSERDKYLFSKVLSGVIKDYNKALETKIEELRKEYPSVNIILFDAAKAFNNLMEGIGPEGQKNFDYGIDLNASFTKLSSPGEPDIRIGKPCYTGGYLGSTDEREICKNASEMIFWDEVHPTSIGHCGIAFLLHNQLFKEGLVSIPADFEKYRKDCK